MSVAVQKIYFLIILPPEVSQCTLLASPLIRCMQMQVEGAMIDVLGKTSQQEYFYNSPYINNYYHWGQQNLIATLQDQLYHYIIDLESSTSTWRLKNKIKAFDFSINNHFWRKYLYLYLGINKLPNTHFINTSFDLVKVFDVTYDQKGVDIFYNETIVSNQEKPRFDKYILFPLLENNTTEIPTNTLLDICRHIEKPILVINSKQYESESLQLVNQLFQKEVQQLTISNISDVISHIKQAEVIITGATHIVHLASAFSKKTITLLGSSDKTINEEAWKPHEESITFEVSTIKCRPCSIFAKKTCPKDHFDCMAKHQGEAVGKHANTIY